MAKEFKDFDKKYASAAGTALVMVKRSGAKCDPEDIKDIEGWAYFHTFTEEYSMSSIRHAVYEAEGAEFWQRFRVSLKGLSTRTKLYALAWYYESVVVGAIMSTQRDRNLIRVNNYLGALKRGGQLDSALRVIKG